MPQTVLTRSTQLSTSGMEKGIVLPTLSALIEKARTRPRDAEASLAVSTAHDRREEYGLAFEWAERAVALDPGNWRCHEQRGRTLTELGRNDEAHQAYTIAAGIPSSAASIRYRLAELSLAAGQHTDAEKHSIEAIRMSSTQIAGYEHLAKALIERFDAEEALGWGKKHLAGFGNTTHLLQAVITKLVDRGRHEEAERMIDTLSVSNPKNVTVDQALARIAKQRGNMNAAGQHYLRWLQADPADYRARISYTAYLLSIGDVENAKLVATIALAQNGETTAAAIGDSLDGCAVLLEFKTFGGHGDAIQFVRFAQRLSESGAKVIVVSRPRIASLLATAPGVDRVIIPHDDCAEANYAIDAVTLWMLLDEGFTSVGGYVPYVHPTLRLSLEDSLLLSETAACKVGVIWRCSNQVARNPFTARNISLSCLKPFSYIPGVRLFSLQAGSSRSEILENSWEDPIIDLDENSDSFEACASRMDAMDLIVAIDTGPAHLAGALGIPVFLMLPYAPEWRWMVGRSDSPWYPTMRLFRQESPGDWSSVVSKVASAIRKFVVSRNNARLPREHWYTN